jgi:hypothetical protein
MLRALADHAVEPATAFNDDELEALRTALQLARTQIHIEMVYRADRRVWGAQ